MKTPKEYIKQAVIEKLGHYPKEVEECHLWDNDFMEKALECCLNDHYIVIDELAKRHANLHKLFKELDEKIKAIIQ
jgi:hypothetical protein